MFPEIFFCFTLMTLSSFCHDFFSYRAPLQVQCHIGNVRLLLHAENLKTNAQWVCNSSKYGLLGYDPSGHSYIYLRMGQMSLYCTRNCPITLPSRQLTVHWQPTMLKLHKDSSFTPPESQNCHVGRLRQHLDNVLELIQHYKELS